MISKQSTIMSENDKLKQLEAEQEDLLGYIDELKSQKNDLIDQKL